MTRQVSKGVRLPKSVVEHIMKQVKTEGSTFSQFVRTAAIEKLRRSQRAA